MQRWSRLFLILLAVPFLAGINPFSNKRTPEQERADIREMRSDVLGKLYRYVPAAENRIRNAAGYAVFSNVGVNLLLVSSGNGYGIAHDNGTGKETFMKVLSAGVGLGYGVKDFRAVFVFESESALNRFIEEGWQATAQTDAAAKAGSSGEAVSYEMELAPDVKLYQLTENGLALQATLQGTSSTDWALPAKSLR